MPLQVLCYERADDICRGRERCCNAAQGIRETFPELDPAEIPMAAAVTEERVLYLLDPIGATSRSFLPAPGFPSPRAGSKLVRVEDDAFELPWTPAFCTNTTGSCFLWDSSINGSGPS